MNNTSLQSLEGYMYSGSFEHKQFPTTSAVDYTYLSPVQEDLYKRLLKGLSYYSKEELYAMNSTKKKKIQLKHIKTQHALNMWKQELTNKITNKLLSDLFPNSNLIKEITENSFTSTNFINTLSFKDLKITKSDVINKLIQVNMLPNNFATL